MKNKVFILIISLVLFSTVQMVAQTKRALVVGIGQQEDASWAKINGDKDVPLVKDMLKTAGYKQIKTLVNKEATKGAIVKAFGTLANQCRQGDIVYVHFSGHGQQMTDREGDEKDGWDEAWIPYDAYRIYCARDRGEKHLTDDEVGRLLDNIKRKIGETGRMLVVIDACHSGSGTRDLDSTDVAVRGAWDKFIIKDAVAKSRTAEPKRQGWVTVSACKDYQSNFELKGKNVGKLTYALWLLMKNNSDLTNKEVEAQLKTFMLRNPGRSPQTPVMSGELTTDEIFKILK